MNLTSFLANKCFEYLLKCDDVKDSANSNILNREKSRQTETLNSNPPPWVADKKQFKNLCDGCGVCVSSCERDILIFKKSGFPVVDFNRGTCSFCGACAKNCPTGALKYSETEQPWNSKAGISGKCLMKNNVICNTCSEHCDKEAIISPVAVQKDLIPGVMTEKCNGCGACVSVCPVNAITVQDNK